jgi:hypothetical protein
MVGWTGVNGTRSTRKGRLTRSFEDYKHLRAHCTLQTQALSSYWRGVWYEAWNSKTQTAIGKRHLPFSPSYFQQNSRNMGSLLTVISDHPSLQSRPLAPSVDYIQSKPIPETSMIINKNPTQSTPGVLKTARPNCVPCLTWSFFGSRRAASRIW